MKDTLEDLLKEHDGNVYAAYADVSNRALDAAPDEQLLAVIRELEHRITLAAMEEYHWEQTVTGHWRYVNGREFFSRYKRDKQERE